MKRRVALVIGAGSVKCAAALGLWRALERHGIELDMVVGCSGGSLYAAVMARQKDGSWLFDRWMGFSDSTRTVPAAK